MVRKSSRYYDIEHKRGITLSAAMHLLWLVLVVFGLPVMLSSPRIEEPHAITVEILPITGITNVKPSEKLPTPQEKEAEKSQAKPSPPVQTAEPAPAPLPKPEEKPKEKEKKPEEKPKEKPKEKTKEKPKEDLAAVLKAVKDTAQKEKKKNDKEAKDSGETKSVSSQYDPTIPMSLSEKDAIRSQIAKCWNVPAGAKDAHQLIVVLRLQLQPDGSVMTVDLARESRARYNSDSFYRAAADSAMRAVRQCSPLKNLPQDKYGTWKDMELTFDPKEMLF